MIIPELNVEFGVIKKTNKYVYFINGAYLSYGKFHAYKQKVRQTYNRLYAEAIHKERKERCKQLDIKLNQLLNQLL